jgi:hypothetical protein
MSDQLYAPCPFNPWERASTTHCIGGWDGPRARVDTVENKKCVASAVNRTLAVQPVTHPRTD